MNAYFLMLGTMTRTSATSTGIRLLLWSPLPFPNPWTRTITTWTQQLRQSSTSDFSMLALWFIRTWRSWFRLRPTLAWVRDRSDVPHILAIHNDISICCVTHFSLALLDYFPDLFYSWLGRRWFINKKLFWTSTNIPSRLSSRNIPLLEKVYWFLGFSVSKFLGFKVSWFQSFGFVV